jgi:cyclic 2,3-diphosphoglycerate synthase
VPSLPIHLAEIPTAVPVIALVDGEHYPTAVADTIAELQEAGWKITAVALTGGAEKLREEPNYGVPHARADTPLGAVLAALKLGDAYVVVDLSDEPALVFEQRMDLIAGLAARQLGYVGADLIVPLTPARQSINTPSLAVIGTGKRIGKTAVSAHLARVADAALGGAGEVVVVAMGRGGPGRPVTVDRNDGPVTVERLLELSRAGKHAASDYLEDAALTGLTTIGCRRVGGGILGVPVSSNVEHGARIADELGARLVIFEGSGACIPPVSVDANLLIASTNRPRDLLEDAGSFRLDSASLVLVMGPKNDAMELAERAKQHVAARNDSNATVIAAQLVPTPTESVKGAKAAVFMSAPANIAPIFDRAIRDAGAKVVLVSNALARRPELRDDVQKAIEAGADTFVVEIKAAGIDVVAEAAAEHDIRLVFLDNRPVAHDKRIDLDRTLSDFARAVAGAD